VRRGGGEEAGLVKKMAGGFGKRRKLNSGKQPREGQARKQTDVCMHRRGEAM